MAVFGEWSWWWRWRSGPVSGRLAFGSEIPEPRPTLFSFLLLFFCVCLFRDKLGETRRLFRERLLPVPKSSLRRSWRRDICVWLRGRSAGDGRAVRARGQCQKCAESGKSSCRRFNFPHRIRFYFSLVTLSEWSTTAETIRQPPSILAKLVAVRLSSFLLPVSLRKVIEIQINELLVRIKKSWQKFFGKKTVDSKIGPRKRKLYKIDSLACYYICISSVTLAIYIKGKNKVEIISKSLLEKHGKYS